MRLLNVLRWSGAALLILALALPALLIGSTGHTAVEVDGGSMEPTYALGDIVTIRAPRPADLVPGAVVTVSDGAGGRYTHRITAIAEDGGLVLRGDANDSTDPEPVGVESVVGVVDGHVSGLLARAVIELQGWPLRICMLVIVLGLTFLPMASRAPVRTPRRVVTELPIPHPRTRREARAAWGRGSAAGWMAEHGSGIG